MTIAPYNVFRVITKSDTVDIVLVAGSALQGIYVGGTGDLTVVQGDGETALFSAVPAGTTLPINVKRVNSTGTTATLMMGLYRV